MPALPGGLTTGLAWALSAWLAGGLLTLPLETLIQPRGEGRTRPASAWVLQFGLWTLAFNLLMLLSQRPVFAAGLGLAGALVVVLVNNAKYRVLQETFLFSDFGLFSQAFRHPRLYLPFLDVRQALAGITAVGLSLYLGLWLEPALPIYTGWTAFLVLAAGGSIAGMLMIRIAGRAAPVPTLKPELDLSELGLAASLWLYWRLERSQPPSPVKSPFQRSVGPGNIPDSVTQDKLPHIVAVQSESFFDARRLLDTVRPQILAHFECSARAGLRGHLDVPAWGANTMRTEFGFLTGISANQLGVHQFNPYRRYVRQPIPSLASFLRALGYRTICIHPHPASFFSRDRVFPLLGFDNFIDVRHFDPQETCGPYICDAAVTRAIGDLLADSDRPLFIFAITMENHGPLHLEQVAPGDTERLYTTPPADGFEDLTVYLRHLENADTMLDELTGILSRQPRDGLLCWFGDHVPSMPRVYANLGYTDGRTDYLIWRQGTGTTGRRDLAVEDLGAALIDAAGLGTMG